MAGLLVAVLAVQASCSPPPTWERKAKELAAVSDGPGFPKLVEGVVGVIPSPKLPRRRRRRRKHRVSRPRADTETTGIRAYLRGVDFSLADLTNIWLPAADLREANLTGARLAGANLAGATLARATLVRADLTGAVLTDVDLVMADLGWADLTNARLDGATLGCREIEPSGREIGPSDFGIPSNIYPAARLRNAVLRAACLCGADLVGVDLRGADLRDSCLRGADLRGADLSKARLDRADFWAADLRAANFAEAVLALPDGESPTFDGALYDAATVWPQRVEPHLLAAVRMDPGTPLMHRLRQLSGGTIRIDLQTAPYTVLASTSVSAGPCRPYFLFVYSNSDAPTTTASTYSIGRIPTPPVRRILPR